MDSAGDGVDDAGDRSAGPVEPLPGPEAVDRRRLEVRQQEDAEFQGLIRRIAEGDDEALATLYDQASARIYGLLLRILRSPDQAAVVTEEVFVEVWRQARRYHRSEGMVFAWIVAIAHERGIACVRAAAGESPARRPAARPRATPAGRSTRSGPSSSSASAVPGSVPGSRPCPTPSARPCCWRTSRASPRSRSPRT